MKKAAIIFTLLAIVILFTPGLFAQVYNLTNMSAEWIRMSNQSAATDAADIVVYNPAGLTKLTDGFHLNLGAGFTYAFSNKFKVNAAAGLTIWKDESIILLVLYPMGINIETTNITYTTAIGADITV